MTPQLESEGEINAEEHIPEPEGPAPEPMSEEVEDTILEPIPEGEPEISGDSGR